LHQAGGVLPHARKGRQEQEHTKDRDGGRRHGSHPLPLAATSRGRSCDAAVPDAPGASSLDVSALSTSGWGRRDGTLRSGRVPTSTASMVAPLLMMAARAGVMNPHAPRAM